MDFNKPPYWDICRLSPYNDHFRVMYQDYKDVVHLADVSFNDGKWEFIHGVHYEILEDDAIDRFRDSLHYNCSFLNDNIDHRKFILEFQIANANEKEKGIKVFYIDENGEWQHEIWSFYSYDGFIEIVNPNITSAAEIKRFFIKETPIMDIVNWVIDDIRSLCGNNYMFWIDLD